VKKNIFSNFSDQDLHDGGIYFPCLLNFSDYESRLNEKGLEAIKRESGSFFSISSKDRATEIVKTYFDLHIYGDLNRLERLDWATQLIDRKVILDKLGQDLKPYYADQLQFQIFTLLHRPIASNKRFLFYSPTKSRKDLALGELHSISKAYIEDGTFDQINHILGHAESDPNYDLSVEEEGNPPINSCIY